MACAALMTCAAVAGPEPIIITTEIIYERSLGLTMDDKFSRELSETDRQILHLLQYKFPISKRPFRDLAIRLGLKEKEIIAKVAELSDRGFIRRLGATIDSRKIGYVSILVALKVRQEKISQISQVVNGFSGVTHNYLRKGKYNMWFTAIAPDQSSLLTILRTIGKTDGVEALLPLPAKRIFKVNVTFPLISE